MADIIVNTSSNMTDFYPFMTDNNVVKWAAWVFSFTFTLTGPCALYSVIWFERFGSDNKRTLLNMLFSQMCWIIIGYIFIAQITEMARYVVGPMFGWVCFLQSLARFSLAGMGGLYLNGILISR